MLASHLESALAWFQRVAELFEAQQPEACELAPVAVEVAPVKAETVTASAPAKPASDAQRVSAMRRFYAVAKAVGLNLKDALGMTWALAKYLRRVVSSRADLSTGSWAEATEGVRFGLLSW